MLRGIRLRRKRRGEVVVRRTKKGFEPGLGPETSRLTSGEAATGFTFNERGAWEERLGHDSSAKKGKRRGPGVFLD